MKKLIILFLFLCFQAHAYTKRDLMGVWKLTAFYSLDQDGNKEEWCGGAQGYLTYTSKFMNLSINCETVKPRSNAERLGGFLFISGPYLVNTAKKEVIHKVVNYNHKSLHKTSTRKITMKGRNRLRLMGIIGYGTKVFVEWKRVESFTQH